MSDTNTTMMLWLCGSPPHPPTAQDVKTACEYYRTKYGDYPLRVAVHPELDEMPSHVNGVDVETSRWLSGRCSLYVIPDQPQSNPDAARPVGQLSLEF